MSNAKLQLQRLKKGNSVRRNNRNLIQIEKHLKQLQINEKCVNIKRISTPVANVKRQSIRQFQVQLQSTTVAPRPRQNVKPKIQGNSTSTLPNRYHKSHSNPKHKGQFQQRVYSPKNTLKNRSRSINYDNYDYNESKKEDDDGASMICHDGIIDSSDSEFEEYTTATESEVKNSNMSIDYDIRNKEFLLKPNPILFNESTIDSYKYRKGNGNRNYRNVSGGLMRAHIRRNMNSSSVLTFNSSANSRSKSPTALNANMNNNHIDSDDRQFQMNLFKNKARSCGTKDYSIAEINNSFFNSEDPKEKKDNRPIVETSNLYDHGRLNPPITKPNSEFRRNNFENLRFNTSLSNKTSYNNSSSVIPLRTKNSISNNDRHHNSFQTPPQSPDIIELSKIPEHKPIRSNSINFQSYTNFTNSINREATTSSPVGNFNSPRSPAINRHSYSPVSCISTNDSYCTNESNFFVSRSSSLKKKPVYPYRPRRMSSIKYEYRKDPFYYLEQQIEEDDKNNEHQNKLEESNTKDDTIDSITAEKRIEESRDYEYLCAGTLSKTQHRTHKNSVSTKLSEEEFDSSSSIMHSNKVFNNPKRPEISIPSDNDTSMYTRTCSYRRAKVLAEVRKSNSPVVHPANNSASDKGYKNQNIYIDLNKNMENIKIENTNEIDLEKIKEILEKKSSSDTIALDQLGIKKFMLNGYMVGDTVLKVMNRNFSSTTIGTFSTASTGLTGFLSTKDYIIQNVDNHDDGTADDDKNDNIDNDKINDNDSSLGRKDSTSSGASSGTASDKTFISTATSLTSNGSASLEAINTDSTYINDPNISYSSIAKRSPVEESIWNKRGEEFEQVMNSYREGKKPTYKNDEDLGETQSEVENEI